MTKADLNQERVERMTRIHGRGRWAFEIAVLAAVSMVLVLAVASPAHAGDGKWTLRLEALFMEVHGHDQHVLTIHEIDLDSTPQVDNKTGVNLDTDSGLAYRGEFRYTRGKWGWGLDFFWFNTSQATPNLTAAADGPSGPFNQVMFEIADRHYTSSDPSEVLFYGVLEDTDIAAWTLDLYGVRALAETANSGIHLQFGLRFADFDNDYRAVVGVQDVGGTRLDASSNYDRMNGLLVGLIGDVRLGRSHIVGYIGQSLLLGSVELTSMSREFTGPFSETSTFFTEEVFRTEQDVAIPVTEFRLNWTYRISKLLSLGVGANTSAWWDVPVPPGIIPIEGGDEVLHENTIVFFGLLGAVVLTF
jgi:hypothetical protein